MIDLVVVPGWTFKEIGHIEKGRKIECTEQTMKCGQYCECCGAFMGRWLSWDNEKVWCKDCWRKIK